MTNNSLDSLKELLARAGYAPTNSASPQDFAETSLLLRTDPIFKLITDAVRPLNLIELGSWAGRSAITWLHNAPRDATIVCVDTFLGSWEHVLDINPSSEWGGKNLKFQQGFPSIYETFLSNIVKAGFSRKVLPICNTTQNAFEILKRLNLKFELVYVDAAHDYVPVMCDLEIALQLVAKPTAVTNYKETSNDAYDSVSTGGVIVGDDFDSWESVSRAVMDFCAANKLTLFTGSNNWVITDFLENSIKSILEIDLISSGYLKQEFQLQNHLPTVWESSRNEQIIQYQAERDELLLLRQLKIQFNDLKIEKNSLKYQLELIKSSNFWRRYQAFIHIIDSLKSLRTKNGLDT